MNFIGESNAGLIDAFFSFHEAQEDFKVSFCKFRKTGPFE